MLKEILVIFSKMFVQIWLRTNFLDQKFRCAEAIQYSTSEATQPNQLLDSSIRLVYNFVRTLSN